MSARMNEIRPYQALMLAGVLSILTISAAKADSDPTDPTPRRGASMHSYCDGDGRIQKRAQDRQSSRDWCRVLGSGNPSGNTDQSVADDGPPGVGEGNG